VSSTSVWIFALALSAVASDRAAAGQSPMAAPRRACPPSYFELLGDLPGSIFNSEAYDVSGDGARVVGNSWAESCGPAHCFEAFGWTRPCLGKPFLSTPASILHGSGGMVGLGYLPSDPQESAAYGISPDGLEVAGWCTVGSGGLNEAVIFSRNGLIRRLGMLDGHITSFAADASDRVNGHERDPDCGLDPDELRTWKRRVIVGYSSTQVNQPKRTIGAKAVYWAPWPCSPTALPLPASAPNGDPIHSSEAVCVSDDGSVIGGNFYHGVFDDDGSTDGTCPFSYESVACVWVLQPTGEYVFHALDDLPLGLENALVHHVSGDGSLMVGSGNDAVGIQACAWRIAAPGAPGPAASGPIAMGRLAGFQYSIAQGVDEHGTVVVGVSGSFDCTTFEYDQRATLWTVAGGTPSSPMDLVELLHLANLGPEIDANWKTTAHRVSSNGRTIVGIAEHPAPPPAEDGETVIEGWIAAFP
jgi:uncharacterized membrane protein